MTSENQHKGNIMESIILIFLLSIPLLLASFHAYRIVKWKMYIWLPDYIRQQITSPKKTSTLPIHVIFIFVDHYEPGYGEKGIQKNNEWLDNYRELSDLHKDSYGRKPQHTWFYPYDHKNDGVVKELSKMAYDGYGEIEFHLHHDHDNNETFPAKLAEAIAWFNSFGAMKSIDGTVSFGFIHGNWSLDNAKGDNFCGVTRELEILKNAGCYADFTFPAFGDISQPAKINSIYYAPDDDKPKSYNKGIDAAVGKQNDKDLMIFEGPLSLKDYSAVESFNVPSPVKIDSWVDQHITVKGRPDWVFVKIFTHGIQSRNVFFNDTVNKMFSYLENKYGSGNYRLHYVSAREAYNIVRAAENGMSDDPDKYRNYVINEPINKSIRIN